jgi:hypothetical protein
MAVQGAGYKGQGVMNGKRPGSARANVWAGAGMFPARLFVVECWVYFVHRAMRACRAIEVGCMMLYVLLGVFCMNTSTDRG